MHSSLYLIHLAAIFTSVNAHGVILAAQGTAGSPVSVGMGVELSLARNCTMISPCQQDTGIIRQAEIDANIVNTCGRTQLMGNIDIGAVTEDQIAAKAVTQVTKGGTLTMTIHQVNADGAGPYTCDLDQTSNAGGFKGNLTVTNNIPGSNGLSQIKEQDFNITITMPTDMACIGGSTGNICTVRCRNNSVAGPFGGCVAVQQTDITPASLQASTIKTAATLKGIQAQVVQDNMDLKAAVDANNNIGSAGNMQAVAVVSALLGQTQVLKAAPVQTLSSNMGSLANPVVAGAAAAAPAVTPTPSAAAKGNGKGSGTKAAKNVQ